MDFSVEMVGISKYFPSSEVQANKDVDFQAYKGEIHSLVGENGAGKTTLMNILYGIHQADTGKILIDGRETQISNPQNAILHGINMVHQHFKLVPSFTVAQNILLGSEPTQFGLIQAKKEIQLISDLADTYGLPINPTALVRDLPVGLQQRVEILKALYQKARILLLDEPTAVLTPREAKELFEILRKLAAQGCTIIFITHKLPEVMEVADRVTVMRQGKVVDTSSIKDTNIPELAHKMVGRAVLFQANKKPMTPGRVLLEIKNIAVVGNDGVLAVNEVSLAVRENEILGIAGVNGNGQNELVEAITGMRPAEIGNVYLDGANITRLSVGERRDLGIAHIPEDRMNTGLNLNTTIDENLIGTMYRNSRLSRLGFLLENKIREFTRQIIKQFSIASARQGEEIATLSGGNLQKIVIGRELSGKPDVIIANEPTRGLDIGSIEFVHKTLIEARDRGTGILLVSADLDEIRSISDRIVVMYKGKIAGELSGETVTEDNLGTLMGGGKLNLSEAAHDA